MTNKAPSSPLALGYIRGNEVTSRFMESLLSVLFLDKHYGSRIDNRVFAAPCSHYLNLGRNALIRQFLADPESGEVIVLIDTDQTFMPGQVHLLADCVDELDRPIVSGLYYAADDLGRHVRPVLGDIDSQGKARTAWGKAELTPCLVEVDEVGMGFCAIHRSVFLEMREHIGEHWFDFDEREDGEFMLEDAAFCRRAKLHLGKKISVHTGIKVGHIKPIEVREWHVTKRATGGVT